MSFTAIHKLTNELWDVQNIIGNLRFPEPEKEEWLIDPNSVESGYEEAVKLYGEIKVVLISPTTFINYNGTRVFKPPHFRCYNSSKYGLNIIPETIEHKQAKQFIFQYLKNPKSQLLLKYAEKNKPYKYDNIIKLTDLDINHSMIGLETGDKDAFGRRIADIYLPFNTKHEFYGDGIYFEIQFSKQRDSTKYKRTIERLSKYSSVVWLYKNDFNEDFTELLDYKVQIEAWGSGFYKIKKQVVKDLKFEVKKIIQKIDQEKKELENNEIFSIYKDIKKIYFEISKISNNLNKDFFDSLYEDYNTEKKKFSDNINKYLDNIKFEIQDEINNKTKGAIEYAISIINEAKTKPEWIKCKECKGEMFYKSGYSQKGKWEAYFCDCGNKRWI